MFFLLLLSSCLSTSKMKKVDIGRGRDRSEKGLSSPDLGFNRGYAEQIGGGVKDTEGVRREMQVESHGSHRNVEEASRTGLAYEFDVEPSPLQTYLYSLTSGSGSSLTFQQTYVLVNAPPESTPTPTLLVLDEFKSAFYQPAALMSTAIIGLFLFCSLITVFCAKKIKACLKKSKAMRDAKFSRNQTFDNSTTLSIIEESHAPTGKRALKRLRRKTDARMRRESIV